MFMALDFKFDINFFIKILTSQLCENKNIDCTIESF